MTAKVANAFASDAASGHDQEAQRVRELSRARYKGHSAVMVPNPVIGLVTFAIVQPSDPGLPCIGRRNGGGSESREARKFARKPWRWICP